jgi:hypothetical protein
MPKLDARKNSSFRIGGEIEMHRLGFGAMRITGPRVWGPPVDMAEAIHTLKRLLELGIDFIDTADSYGPEVSEQLIRQVLYIPITGRPGEVLVTSAQIRAARGLLDWTVRDLAERSGVHRDMANKIETGAYAGPPPGRLKRSGVPSNMLASSSPTAMR